MTFEKWLRENNIITDEFNTVRKAWNASRHEALEEAANKLESYANFLMSDYISSIYREAANRIHSLKVEP